MEVSEAYQLVMKEMANAHIKHGNFPTDCVYGAAIVMEEAGEVIQAALNVEFKRGSKQKLRSEVAQTAAAAIWFLSTL